MAGKMSKREPRERSRALLIAMPKLRGFHAKQREHPKRPMPERKGKR